MRAWVAGNNSRGTFSSVDVATKQSALMHLKKQLKDSKTELKKLLKEAQISPQPIQSQTTDGRKTQLAPTQTQSTQVTQSQVLCSLLLFCLFFCLLI